MFFGESTVEDVSNGEQVFPILFDGFDLPVDSEPSGQWVVHKYQCSSSADWVKADGSSGMKISKGADRGAVILKTLHKIPCGVVANYSSERSLANYGMTMFGYGEPAGEYGADSNEWWGTLGTDTYALKVKDATSTTQNQLGKVTTSNTWSGAWINGETIYDTLNTPKVHKLTWNESEMRLSSNGIYSGHYTSSVTRYDSYFAYSQGYYSVTGSITIHWVGLHEYVATEPSISVGTAGANPEYVGGEEPTYNLLVGFTGSNF
jgi:hypothetical protein